MSAKPILSVGIDVGTTSTHLTVSRLHLQNVSKLTEPSRLVIGRREIVYQGAVHFTPLMADQRVDAEAVADILRKEYAEAGVAACDIATGAVIVTGETAHKRNAAQLSKQLRRLAGRFVVASAGPNLEGMLAARGSGAAAASQETGKTIGNIDIGGGTTNIAVYAAGAPAATGCLAIGGRFLCLSDRMELLSLSESGQLLWQEALGSAARPGSKLDDAVLERVCTYAAGLILDFVRGASDRPDGRLAPLVVSSFKLPPELEVDEWWFSGGVAETMRRSPGSHETAAPRIRYGDVGPWLGEAIVDLLEQNKMRYHIPDQPIRATVIGAGLHSLQLSGSTVSVEASALPITDMPVIRPFKRSLPPLDDLLGSTVTETICFALHQQDLDWQKTPLALFIPELPALTYTQVNAWARALSGAFTNLDGRAPLVVICAFDVGAALGLALRKLSPERQCIVLDGIGDACGDFIDIGEPIANQQAIPVVLKDLIFGSSIV